MKGVNSNLITLKLVLFLFFGGLGCLMPFLPQHMIDHGLTDTDIQIICMVAPCVAILGPAIAGPLADKLAGGSKGVSRSATGRYLRVMIAICFIMAAIFYWLLMAVPISGKDKSDPELTLVCDSNGGTMFQKKCADHKPCAEWYDKKIPLYVTNCVSLCNGEEEETEDVTSPFALIADSSTSEYDENYDERNVLGSGEGPANEAITPDKRPYHRVLPEQLPKPHPLAHLCYNSANGSVCDVYTASKPVKLRVNLGPSIFSEGEYNYAGDKFCSYPVENSFHCRQGPRVENNKTIDVSSACNATIRCKIHIRQDKLDSSSLLAGECGYNKSTFWLYLLIRPIADIFPAAALALLAAAVVIATRETSTGRGDVGKQFAVAALGLGIFSCIVGIVDIAWVSVTIFTVLMILGAIILLFDNNMPLSPPEWWWHTRCGLLALPLSTIRKYSLETASLAVILMLLGVFWHGVDSFSLWKIHHWHGNALAIGISVAVGALSAVMYLVCAERIVDYCGHNNIFIACFTLYIIHYTGIAYLKNTWWLIVCEAIEIYTLHLMYATAVMYLRHLVPRKFTASGQALAIIAHFCLGRLIGALITYLTYKDTSERFTDFHSGMAIAAAVLAIIYFLFYHFYLKPRCAAPISEPPRPSPALIQSANGNGSYTPLRVYHNSKAKKGHFRY